jgi:beta-glucanase (GH16 family)
MNRRLFNKITGACVMLAFVIFSASCKKDSTPTGKITITPPDVKPVTPVTPVTYSLVWSDEFSGTKVDTSKWNMETGNLNVNNEKEYYQAANATIENGNLVITAKQESVGGLPYTSARMNTLNKISAKYGRIEARIKLPLANGLWPAFWMMGSNIQSVSWPNCGEIDIMEHINADNMIYGTIHWNGGGGHVQYGDKTTTTTLDDYHIYAIEWDNNEIRWYVDDKLFVTANIAANINNTAAFHLPFFILLNMAVAGDFPGQTVDQGKLPAKMYVDYVRVYKAN